MRTSNCHFCKNNNYYVFEWTSHIHVCNKHLISRINSLHKSGLILGTTDTFITSVYGKYIVELETRIFHEES